MDREIKQQFELINKKLNNMSASLRKETWVASVWVSKLTDWNYRDLELARRHKLIEFKKEGGGYLYKLESIPEQFIKKVS